MSWFWLMSFLRILEYTDWMVKCSLSEFVDVCSLAFLVSPELSCLSCGYLSSDVFFPLKLVR